MQLYNISDEYINYLRNKFPRVYSNKEYARVHTRKYLGTVIENGKKTVRKDSLIVMRIVSGNGDDKELKGTLQIGTMIPVPDDAIVLYDVDNEPDQAYKDLVQEEIVYIRKHENKIVRNARIL